MVAALALGVVLLMAMAPRLGPMAHEVGARVVAVTGPGAPSQAAPALPASALGDQHFEWSRAACLGAGGVERAEHIGDGQPLVAAHLPEQTR